MSWQEKIERYKKEQQQKVEKAARFAREQELRATKEKTKEKKEKIFPLLETLERFHCEALLTQIRDEFWRTGEVFTTPKLEEVTSKTPVMAAAVLMARWPCYEQGGGYWESGSENANWIAKPECIGQRIRALAIRGEYSSEGEVVLIIGEYSHCWGEIITNLGETNKAISQLEHALTVDCAGRSGELPYSQYLESPDPRVVELIRKGHKPPEGFEYLLNLAKKGRR